MLCRWSNLHFTIGCKVRFRCVFTVPSFSSFSCLHLERVCEKRFAFKSEFSIRLFSITALTEEVGSFDLMVDETNGRNEMSLELNVVTECPTSAELSFSVTKILWRKWGFCRAEENGRFGCEALEVESTLWRRSILPPPSLGPFVRKCDVLFETFRETWRSNDWRGKSFAGTELSAFPMAGSGMEEMRKSKKKIKFYFTLP